MDEPALPDDPRDWPTDPFTLLGVARGIGETDLKRAYTRLIRKYKPEHAPEEFRRIREAYEAIIEMSRWYWDSPPIRDVFLSPPFEPPGPFVPVEKPTPSEPVERGWPAALPHETQIDPPVRPARVDPVEDAWAAAVAGDWTTAYAALVALAEAHPDPADLPLRLYWLLALRPSLDASRTRHDWLASALDLGRLSGPAVELYRRELATDPSTLSLPYLRLLELRGLPAASMLEVARMRLAAAAAEQRWVTIEVDLNALAERADELDEKDWLSYLTDVSGVAAYSQTQLGARCTVLLASLKHLELRHAWAFDRMDEQKASARVWHEALSVPEPIRGAVAAAWGGGDRDKSLAAATSWAATNPTDALRRCDQVTRGGVSVLAAFARMLTELRGAMHSEPEYPPHLIRGLVRAYLTNHGKRDYLPMRESLLRFLLAERIDPEELIAACAGDSTERVRSIVEQLRPDRALWLIYRAVCWR
jgi:hypothetical protein